MVLATSQAKEKETMGTAWDLASEMAKERGWVEVVAKLESLKYNFRQY